MQHAGQQENLHIPRPTEHTTMPPEYISSINNSQVTQITYTALYKHVELLCNDALQLCCYMISSHILPPNA